MAIWRAKMRRDQGLSRAALHGSMSVVPRTSQVSHLLLQFHAGDGAARDRLIEYASDRLRALAHGMLRENRLKAWEQSDDLLQQTLIRLHRRLESCKIDNVQAFFRLSALEMRHALIDFARRYFGPLGMSTHQAPPDECNRVQFAECPSASSRHEQVQHLVEAVDRLPEDEKEVVDLLWIQGFSQAEVAELLAVSPKTVGRRWARARVRLHCELSDELSNR